MNREKWQKRPNLFPSASRFTVLLAASLTVLSGCTGTTLPNISTGSGDGEKTKIASTFVRFPDMPLPNGHDIDMKGTFVFGSEENWYGRLAILTSYDVNEMFDFYKQELARFGWQEIASLRSAVSVLTYVRENRVATLQIQERTLLGSSILISVSPKEDSGAFSTPAPGQPGVSGNSAPMAAPVYPAPLEPAR